MSLFKKMIKSNKGLSLVELIVTIALMSIVSVAVGSAVVSATSNYRRNSEEVDLQQNVQNVTNILANMIFDSSEANNIGGESSASENNLFIKSSSGVYYTITLQGGTLYYEESKTGYPSVTSTTKRVLAENVDKFVAKTDTYSVDYVVKISLSIKGQSSDKEMKTSFAVASRNAEGGGDVNVTEIDGAVIAVETLEIAEPNQTLTIPYDVLVAGTVTDTSIKAPYVYATGDVTPVLTATLGTDADGHQAIVITSNDEKNAIVRVRLQTNATNADGTPYDTKDIVVHIRRATEMLVNGSQTNAGSVSNCKNGAAYEVKSNLKASNGDRYFALKSDNDYVTPYKVVWTVTGSVSKMTGITNPAGGNSVSGDIVCNDANGKWTFKLNSDFNTGDYITFTCRALHPDGTYGGGKTNKTGIAYGEIIDSWTLVSGFFDNVDSDYKRGMEKTWNYGANAPQMDQTIKKYYLEHTKEYLDRQAAYIAAQNEITRLTALRDASVSNSSQYWEYANAIGRVNDYINNTLQYNNIITNTYNDITSKYEFHFDVFGSVGTYTETGELKWSEYRMLSNGGTNYTITKPNAYRMDPDKTYQFEFVCVLYYKDKASGKYYIAWPRYDRLLQSGFGFEGFSANWTQDDPTLNLGNWKNQGKAGTITATSSGVTVSTTEFVVKDDELPVNQYPEFARTMEVTKGSFEFSENTSLGIAKDAATAGSVDSPILLKLGQGGSTTIYLEKSSMTGLGMNEFMHIDGILQRLNSDGTWETITESIYDGTGSLQSNWGFTVSRGDGWFQFTQKSKTFHDETFRVLVDLSHRPRAYIKAGEGALNKNLYLTSPWNGASNDGLYNLVVDTDQKAFTYKLYDLDTDSGILYFKITNPSGGFETLP